MSITSKELAAMLNVSPSAVSLALNGKPGVSEARREMILDAAARYNHNARQYGAAAPAPNIRYVIYAGSGHVVDEISFHSIVLQGIEAQAKKLGYNVLVSYLSGDDDKPEQIASLFQNVAGVILLGTEMEDDWLQDNILEAYEHTPIVLVDYETFYSEVDCVYTHNLRGAYQAIRYLLELGHKRIGYLCSIQRIRNFDERKEGVLKAISDHPEVNLQFIPMDFSTEKAYDDMCEWLEGRPDMPTAFFADSDIIAFGALRAFHQFGYQIPSDISIIGFDDMPACEMVTPPLTTVRVMKELMGSAAVETLHKRILEGDKVRRSGVFRTSVSTHIQERNSCGQCPSPRGTNFLTT